MGGLPEKHERTAADRAAREGAADMSSCRGRPAHVRSPVLRSRPLPPRIGPHRRVRGHRGWPRAGLCRRRLPAGDPAETLTDSAVQPKRALATDLATPAGLVSVPRAYFAENRRLIEAGGSSSAG